MNWESKITWTGLFDPRSSSFSRTSSKGIVGHNLQKKYSSGETKIQNNLQMSPIFQFSHQQIQIFQLKLRTLKVFKTAKSFTS
jgi:hypothetical protein